MDELSDFERRLAAGLDGLVGPRRAVPAAAITQAAMQSAARPPAMRSLRGGRSNSNSRLLYAGIAALLLVAGGIAGFAAAALTNKSEPPAIVPPSASTAPSPTTSTGTWQDEPPFVAYWTGRSGAHARAVGLVSTVRTPTAPEGAARLAGRRRRRLAVVWRRANGSISRRSATAWGLVDRASRPAQRGCP